MFLIYFIDILAPFIDWPPKILTDLNSSLYMQNYLREKKMCYLYGVWINPTVSVLIPEAVNAKTS